MPRIYLLLAIIATCVSSFGLHQVPGTLPGTAQLNEFDWFNWLDFVDRVIESEHRAHSIVHAHPSVAPPIMPKKVIGEFDIYDWF